MKRVMWFNFSDLVGATAAGDFYREEGISSETALVALVAFAVGFTMLLNMALASTINTSRKKREVSMYDKMYDFFWEGNLTYISDVSITFRIHLSLNITIFE